MSWLSETMPWNWFDNQSRRIHREMRTTELAIQSQQLRLRQQLATKIQETLDLTLSCVDPIDAYRDPVNGELWSPIGVGGKSATDQFINNEARLKQVRDKARWFCLANAFAIAGEANRVNYVVGSTGIRYTASIDPKQRPDKTADLTDAEKAETSDTQAIIGAFVKVNKWTHRQQEMQRRKDRDGEFFLRFFETDEDHLYNVRFAEPDDVATPPEHATTSSNAMGIITEPGDVETVLGYWIGGKVVPPSEVQHVKANVDSNVRRGIPLWLSVFRWLNSAERIATSIGAMTEIQASIALIREHMTGTSANVEQFVASKANVSTTNTATGETRNYQRFTPGTILDGNANTSYKVPDFKNTIPNHVEGLRAILRAIASRLTMPEFMLTSDASNANFASTMVAEGPAVKSFERLQWEMIDDDTEVLEMVLDRAVAVSKISQETRDKMIITAEPPRLTTRDRLKEAQADQILVDSDAMSRYTMSVRHDLDPETEQAKIEEEKQQRMDRMDQEMGMGVGAFGPQGRQPEEDDDEG